MFIQTVARILADTLKLRVVYSHTDGTFSISKDANGRLTLTMSECMLAITHESEQRVGTLIRGALAHEALGHGYHTDFGPEAAAKRGAYAASLANAFEDVRIEALAPHRFIGARHILADMAGVVDRHGDWDPPKDPSKWQGALVTALLRKFRTEILHQPLRQDVTDQAIAQARKALGDALYAQVEALAAKACTAPDTATASHYADAIVDLLQQQQPQPQGQGSAQGGDGQQQPNAGNGTGRQQSGNGQDPGKSKDREPGKDGNSQPAQGGVDQATRTAFDPQSATDVTIEHAVHTVCEQEAAPSVWAAPARDDTGEMQRLADTAGGSDAGTGAGGKPAHGKAAAVNRLLANRIASRLERVLRSVTEDGDDLETDTGRLNLTRLPGIVMGTERFPFVADGSWAPGIDTELMLVVDSSGSLAKLVPFLRGLIQASLLALGRFAPELGVSMATFSDRATLLIRPGQHISPALASIVANDYGASGGTLWAASISPLTPILASSHRRRKILLTVTDGRLLSDCSGVRSAVFADLDAQHIEHPFVSIGVPLPPECDGIECEAKPSAVAEALCQAITRTMQPEFV